MHKCCGLNGRMRTRHQSVTGPVVAATKILRSCNTWAFLMAIFCAG